MSKSSKLRAVLSGLFIMTAAAGPVGAQGPQNGTYLYEYRYYSDASQTTVVGYVREQCNGPGPEWGDTSEFYTQRPVGYRDYGSGQCVEY